MGFLFNFLFNNKNINGKQKENKSDSNYNEDIYEPEEDDNYFEDDDVKEEEY